MNTWLWILTIWLIVEGVAALVLLGMGDKPYSLGAKTCGKRGFSNLIWLLIVATLVTGSHGGFS